MVSVKNKKLVLLDAHAILHRAYHALPEFASSKGEPTGGLYGLSTMLIRIIKDLKPDYIAACYDLPQPTYRHEAYEAYKAGRKKADDALVSQMKRSLDIFGAFNIPIYSHAGFEADDMLGTIVEQVKTETDLDVVIASGDMDTVQLVTGKKVQVYTLKKGLNDTILYDENAVNERYGFGPLLLPDYKGLRGDASDNIIGIAGIGEKTATTLIQNFGSIEDIYKKLKKDEEAFLKAGIKPRIIELLKNGEEEARFSKMLATIRRDAPIKFDLAKTEWKKNFDMEKVVSLFTELDFRTLPARVRDLLAPEQGSLAGVADFKQKNLNKESVEAVSKELLDETAVALWIIDSNITNPSLDDILHFAKTKSFAKAREIIFEEIKKRKLNKVFEEIEKPLTPVLRDMEQRGILVDAVYLKKLSSEYSAVLSSLEQKIWKEAGVEFNIRSPKQLGEILFDKMGLSVKNQKKTAGGAKSTKESELEKMRDLHPVVPLVLEYRELHKLLSTYIDNIPNMLDGSGRLHTTYMQTGTTTGRLSSTEPNLQNIPIKSDLGKRIRNAFLAPSGFKLVSFDYSQIELRIAAFLSQDKKLIEIFKGGGDVHTAVASQVFGVEPEKVDKEMRRKAKVINFGILYGMGVNALRTNLGTTREEAQNFYNDYFSTFVGLASYLDRIKGDASRLGYTETLFGRRRYFEGINSRLPYIKAQAERMAINAPIQGTSADIIKIAMIRIAERFKKESWDAHMILQVHDELICEVKEDIVSKVMPVVDEIMEGVLDLTETSGVPLIANGSFGNNWGEMEK